MGKTLKMDGVEKFETKSDTFMQKINSDMRYRSELAMNAVSFEWVDQIEYACPYIDNIIRKPRLALINESDVVKIEKARKVTVDSVKDLAKHTEYIDKYDTEKEEVSPSKILITRREETYNTYENRFIYTLILNLARFMLKKEEVLEDFSTKNSKVLEYAATTSTNSERVSIELKIGSKEFPQSNGNDFEDELNDIRARVKKIKDYINSWRRNEFMTSLEKAHVPLVIPPIRKTNMILKNPNFQVAMKLWEFLQRYDENDNGGSKEGLDTAGNDILKGILDDAFLMDFFVLDSIRASRKEQREKLASYAIVMIKKQVQKAVSLLLNSGIEISDEQIITMVANEIKNEKSKRLVGSEDVKKKFKSAMEEYLERTQDCL